MALGNIDRKSVLLYLGVIALSFIVYKYQYTFLNSVKYFITLEYFDLVLTGLLVSLTLFHKLKFNNYSNLKKIEFNEMKSGLADLISTVMDPATLICSISILKGLFLLKVYNIKYFDFFSDNELLFLFIAAVYFFIKSGIEMWSIFLECFLKSSSVEKTVK